MATVPNEGGLDAQSKVAEALPREEPWQSFIGRFRATHPVLMECFSSSVVGIVSSVSSSKEIINDEICHLSAQRLTRSQVRAEMHTGENSTQCSFFTSGRKALKRAIYSCQNFGSNGEIEMILAKEGNQDGCSSSTDNRVCARICGIWRSVADRRKPIRVR